MEQIENLPKDLICTASPLFLQICMFGVWGIWRYAKKILKPYVGATRI